MELTLETRGKNVGTWVILVKSFLAANILVAFPCQSVFDDPNKSLLMTLKWPRTMTSDVYGLIYVGLSFQKESLWVRWKNDHWAINTTRRQLFRSTTQMSTLFITTILFVHCINECLLSNFTFIYHYTDDCNFHVGFIQIYLARSSKSLKLGFYKI